MNSVRSTIKQYIIGAYASFLGMAAICSLIYPEVFDKYEYGLSTFGSVWPTIPLYYLGFAVTIACLIAIILKLRHLGKSTLFMRYMLGASSIFMAGIAITSYSQTRGIYLVHVGFAVLLAIVQLILTVWILKQKHIGALDYVLAAGFVAIVVISVLPIVRHIPIIRSFPLRETLAFICALGIIGRAALRASSRDYLNTVQQQRS